MPGRRRRKLSDNRLKPLMFIESPVNGMPHLPSPVFSSDNPARANVVPADQNLTWVSPQFIDIPGTTGRCRKRCSRKKTAGGQSVNRTYAQHGMRSIETRYKALRFWGEERRTVDVSSDPEDVEDGQDVTGTSCSNGALQDGVVDQANLRAEQCLRKNKLDYDVACDEKRLEHINISCTGSSCEAGYDVKTPDGAGIELEFISEPNNGRNFTRIKPRVLMQLRGTVSTSNTKHGQTRSKCDLVDVQNDHFNTGSDCEFDDIPKRRSSISGRRNNEFFPNSQIQTPVHEQLEVLVYDTPEEDYGLPVRQRRLKDKNS